MPPARSLCGPSRSAALNEQGFEAVAAGITFERLAPLPTRAARATGAVAVTAGVVVMAHAIGIA